ncbi:hypothetical protein F4806DRAFT_503125 [Annulohypoxylon nitens]|nr:hypothetical protein F4806DRAFT_503125 [Annulohypoxylon nitens]
MVSITPVTNQSTSAAQSYATVFEILEEVKALETSPSSHQSSQALRILTPFLSFIDRYSTVADTLVQYDVSPACIIWGSLKMIVRMISGIESWWAKLIGVLGQLGNQLMKYHRYEQLFRDSQALKSALAATYVDIIIFLERIKQRVQNRKSVWAIVRFSLSSFESDFSDISSKLALRFESLDSDVTFIHRRTLHEDLKKQRDFSHQVSHILRTNPVFSPQSPSTSSNPDNHSKIISWLLPVDTTIPYHRHKSKRTPGTCEWMFSHEFFSGYPECSHSENGSDTIRWAHGIPGVGKSSICASFIEKIEAAMIENKGEVVVAYFFFEHASDDSRTVLAIYKALLSQLINHLPSSAPILESAMKSALKYGRMHMSWSDDPESLLRGVLGTARSKICIIVDGIDECKDLGQGFPSFLQILRSNQMCQALFFSRDVPEVRRCLNPFRSMRISPELTQTDIHIYLMDAISRCQFLDSSLRNEVSSALRNRSQGMFLWAALMVQELEGAICSADVIELMERQPTEINSLYDTIIETVGRKPPRWIQLTRNLWTLVCCSPRPLLWDELQYGLTMISPDNVEPTQEYDMRAAYKSAVLKVCPPFVEHEPENDTFSVAHLSIYQYLTEKENQRTFGSPKVDLAYGHKKMATLCLRSLMKPTIHHQQDIGKASSPFENYATTYWCHHLLKSQPDHDLQTDTVQFLACDDRRCLWLARWLALDKKASPLQSMLKSIRSVNRWLQKLDNKRQFHFDELKDVLEVLLILDSQCSERYDSGNKKVISNFERNMVLRDLAREYTMAGRLEDGIQHSKAIIDKLSQGPGTQSCDLSWLMNGLGIMYDQQGDCELAIKTQLEALDAQRSNNTRRELDEVLITNELGRLYRHTGRLEEAEKMHHTALKLLRSSCPDTDPQIIWTLNTLARCYRKQKRLDEAIKLHNKSRIGQSRLLGAEHPHTLWTRSDLAKCYRDLGDLDEAITMQSEVTTIRRRVLGPLHNDTLWSMNDLGIMHELAGQFENALKVHQEALEGQEETLGSSHPSTMWTKKVIAHITASSST